MKRIATLAALGLVGFAGCDDGGGGERPMTSATAADDGGSGMPDTGAPSGDDGGDGGTGDGGDGDGDGGDTGLAPLTPEQVDFYMRRLAPAIAGRSLTYDEGQLIAADGEAAVAQLLDAWMAEPGFPEAIRDMVSVLLAVSGDRDGIDFELPGNLAAHIINEELPWSTIVTADYCVDAAGAQIECDTGAPYEAGVLATRAYLISNKGRFNLGRAKRMLTVFGCRAYPMEMDIQIPLEKPTLIPMFRAETPDEQTVDEAKGGFGNGAGCYTCHAQFGAHAQLFVKYDGDGLWIEDADGLQDPDGELGRSLDGLYASHMDDPSASASEASQIFGEPVGNLSEAGEVIGDHPLFYSCSAKNLIGTAFGLEAGSSTAIDIKLVNRLGEDVMGLADQPTMQQIVTTVFADEEVIRATVAALEAGE